MKFTTAWAKTAHTNSILKVTTASLIFVVISLTTLLYIESLSPPLIIGLGCTTKTLEIQKDEISFNEIKKFLKTALEQRFNTNSQDTNLLGLKETKKRELEQKNLTDQKITQKILIETENIELNENSALISSDRLLSVKDIRTAFLFKLKVSFYRTKRTRSNPYGLILTSAKELESQEK